VNRKELSAAGPKPVLVVDGSAFDDLDGFARQFSAQLTGWEWHGNFDAFNDILRGGCGTPEDGFVLRWTDSERSRGRLGGSLFLTLIEIIRTHGPGGDEAEDGVELELR
jgi:RNAse (barnase) inhibitor barstar